MPRGRGRLHDQKDGKINVYANSKYSVPLSHVIDNYRHLFLDHMVIAVVVSHSLSTRAVTHIFLDLTLTLY